MERIARVGEQLWNLGRAVTSRVAEEARQVVDLDRLEAAMSWRERAAAVSWPRAGIASGGLAVLVLGGVLINGALRPDIRAHAPRLPTEAEWRANQEAARAMEAELSPALAAANQSVTK